jgi:hypothetical protein
MEETHNESTRERVLRGAIQCVCTDRDTQYGSPEDSFTAIAALWSAYTGQTYTAHDVGVMMALLKIARIKTGQYKEDSYIDAAGYIACAAQIGGKEGTE